MAKTTVKNILHKRLKLHYKIQLKHEVKPADKPKPVHFAVPMLSKTNDDETSGCVKQHNCRMWGKQQRRIWGSFYNTFVIDQN